MNDQNSMHQFVTVEHHNDDNEEIMEDREIMNDDDEEDVHVHLLHNNLQCTFQMMNEPLLPGFEEAPMQNNEESGESL